MEYESTECISDLDLRSRSKFATLFTRKPNSLEHFKTDLKCTTIHLITVFHKCLKRYEDKQYPQSGIEVITPLSVSFVRYISNVKL